MMLSSKTPHALKKTNKRPSSIKMASHVKNVNNIGFSNADEIKNECCNKKEILKYKKNYFWKTKSLYMNLRFLETTRLNILNYLKLL
jgi:hypothetical protein